MPPVIYKYIHLDSENKPSRYTIYFTEEEHNEILEAIKANKILKINSQTINSSYVTFENLSEKYSWRAFICPEKDTLLFDILSEDNSYMLTLLSSIEGFTNNLQKI